MDGLNILSGNLYCALRRERIVKDVEVVAGMAASSIKIISIVLFIFSIVCQYPAVKRSLILQFHRVSPGSRRHSPPLEFSVINCYFREFSYRRWIYATKALPVQDVREFFR